MSDGNETTKQALKCYNRAIHNKLVFRLIIIIVIIISINKFSQLNRNIQKKLKKKYSPFPNKLSSHIIENIIVFKLIWDLRECVCGKKWVGFSLIKNNYSNN
jgi:hypothetical protein